MTTARLPGADLVDAGLADLSAGLETVESLLVSIAAPGLRDAGVAVGPAIPDAEMRLYARLSAQSGAAAHSQFNALVRQVSSYRRAAQCVR